MAYWVQVVETDRCYGGPEEGGWWYDWDTVIFEKRTTKRIARKLAKRLAAEVCEDNPSREVSMSEHGDGRYRIVQRARRGRNRFSVIGGADFLVTVRKRNRVESTRKRPHYE